MNKKNVRIVKICKSILFLYFNKYMSSLQPPPQSQLNTSNLTGGEKNKNILFNMMSYFNNHIM